MLQLLTDPKSKPLAGAAVDGSIIRQIHRWLEALADAGNYSEPLIRGLPVGRVFLIHSLEVFRRGKPFKIIRLEAQIAGLDEIRPGCRQIAGSIFLPALLICSAAIRFLILRDIFLFAIDPSCGDIPRGWPEGIRRCNPIAGR